MNISDRKYVTWKKTKREIDNFLYLSGVNYYYIQLLIVSLPTQPSFQGLMSLKPSDKKHSLNLCKSYNKYVCVVDGCAFIPAYLPPV